MLGVITLKDHSLAPVSQGTKAMDTIVQVKFFGFFQVHLKQFSTIRLSLRGDFWHVLKSMRKRECVLTVTDYIRRILHGGAKDMNFIFEWQNNILQTSAASELNIVFATRK